MTTTPTGDAETIEGMLGELDNLRTCLIAIRRRAIFGPGLTTSDLLDLTMDVAGLAPEKPQCVHAPTYDAGLCCCHPDDCTFVAPPKAASRLCDCERGHNGIGMTGRECDCTPAVAELASLRESLAKAEGVVSEAFPRWNHERLQEAFKDPAKMRLFYVEHRLSNQRDELARINGENTALRDRALLAESKLAEAKVALGTALSEMLEARDRLLASGARTSGLDFGIEEAHKALANLETKEPSDV